MYDIAIIGAGPAGATLARLMGNRYHVLLVDRRPLLQPAGSGAGKCCGGLLAPDAQRVMGMMGLALPQDVMVGPQLFVVRTIDLEQNLERYYQRFYINVDREKFDRWLVSLIPSAVDTRFGCLCKEINHDGGCYTIQLTEGGKKTQVRARNVIGADGANSRVRQQLFATSRPGGDYVAIQEWFRIKEATPHFSVFFDPAMTDFYAWSIPKEGQLLVGAALKPGREAGEKFARLKEKLPSLGYNIMERTRREGAFILRPRQAPGLLVQEKAALIGEAAGWISPSSAEGISYAFLSALAAAASMAPGLDGFGERYVRETRHLGRNIYVKNAKMPMMYNPLLRGFVMRSGLQSLKMK
jgi:geranylgeranyl diphosphate/geranylgeranyl-bacteriochlorophyllide a reductase